MSISRSFRATLLVACLAALVPSRAHADERSDARRHFRAGLNLIGQQHYPEGIAELEAAYAILPHPNVLYNIARAYNDMGNTERAVEYLRRYLQNDVPDRAEVEAIIARLEGRLRQQAPAPVAEPVAPVATPPATGTVVIPSGGPAQAQQYRDLARALLQLADGMQGTQTHVAAPVVSSGAPSSGPPASGVPTETRTAARTGPRATTTAVAGAPNRGGTGAGEAINVGTAQDDDAYEERVVTASRVAQSPLDAPNATGIITAQDIRLSGITNLPELLRRVVGVDVMELENSDVQVSARGFNQRMSNKMLVLVDGRSVYLDFMGVTLWPVIPVGVEDIERIEVIRGPGSALYGADAFTGVVNIITRTPGENRTQVDLGIGTGQYLRGAFYTSGRQGSVAYRASASYEQSAAYERLVGDTDRTYQVTAPSNDLSLRAPRVSLDLRTRLGHDATLRGGLGISAPDVWFSAIGPLREFWARIFFAQPYIQLDVGGFTARVFYNHFQAQAEPLLLQYGRNGQLANVDQEVIDADAQYAWRVRLGSFTNTLQVGLGYRFKYISWNYLVGDEYVQHASFYLQDTLRHDRFSAVVSARGDYDSALASPVVSPRASLIYRPDEHRAIRLSGGTAFRTPTMLELYLDFTNNTPVPGASAAAFGGTVAHNNNPNVPLLQPESAISADLGYLDQSFLGSDRINFEANLFFTRGWNLLQLSPVTLDTLPGGCNPNATPPDPRCTDPRISVGGGGFINDPSATYVYGAEIGTRVSPIEGLDIYANYTLALTAHEPNALLNGGNGLPPDQRTPVHKLNVGVQLRTRAGFDFEVFAHYASSQVWLEQVFDVQQGVRYQAFSIPDYVIVNARVGYRLLNDRLDLGIVGTNLTDQTLTDGHVEHPFGARMGARVFATAAYRF